jgi:hypothetical protein
VHEESDNDNEEDIPSLAAHTTKFNDEQREQ